MICIFFEVSLIACIPYIGHGLAISMLTWVYSYYCFEYKWILQGLSLNRRIQQIESNWIYFAGFGAPCTLATYFFPTLVAGGLFGVLFPFFLLTAMCAVEKKKYISYKFKILIVVHLNGHSANILEIKKFCKKNNIKIIEDCAEALFTKFKNKYVGNYGDIATFSFFANKLITTGEGGMCSTNIKKLHNKMRISASHGMMPTKKYWHIYEGFNHRMTSLQSVIGITMLLQVNKFIQARKFNNSFYLKYFKKKNYFHYIKPYDGDNPVMWYFPFILKDKYKNKKIKLMNFLKKKNVETRSFFYPLDSMKIFSNKQICLNANNFSKKGIYLPVDPTLKVNDLKYVCESIDYFFKIK